MRRELEKVIAKEDLRQEEMEQVITMIMEGQATPVQIAGFLIALRSKGEAVAEITGAARVMRKKAARIKTERRGLVDLCGTGGDGLNTFNISTTAAFVVAGAGLPVAKHGNRSVSSSCGSADVLEELGVNLELGPDAVGYCLDKIGLGFLYAPVFHRAMKHAVKPRQELGVRTVFNILGPLTNPAGAEYQLLGVYEEKLTEPLAQVLKNLGVRGALVVHGEDGMDEISLNARTKITTLSQGRISSNYLDPGELGLSAAGLDEIAAGDAAENAAAVKEVLAGKEGARRNIVLLNVAGALVAAGRVQNFSQGLKLAARVIDEGLANRKLQELIELSVSLAA